MKRFKAAIIGGSGYGGGEMIRRLLIHPEVELVRVASVDYVGEPLSAAHPSLEGATPLVFENLSAVEAAKGCDIALLGLPHKVAAQKGAELMDAGVKVVDMSGDYRLKDAAVYQKYYGAAHPCPDRIPQWVYGLPELNREQIRKAKYVASPGCFATTVELGLLPLAKAGLLKDTTVYTQGITGSSGSGVVPGPTTHHPSRAGNLRTYKPLEHQHIPEILQTLEQAGAKGVELRFVPVSAPLVRGIFVTSYVEVPEEWTAEKLTSLFRETYAGEKFVRVPKKRLPEVVAVAGSNYVEVGVAVSAPKNGKRTATCFSVTDNLIKGGAGQAIQNMNLVLGLDEALSLEDTGPFP